MRFNPLHARPHQSAHDLLLRVCTMSKARSPQATRDLGELVEEGEGLGIVAEGLALQVGSIFMEVYGSGGPPDSVRAVASGPYLPPPPPMQ